MFIDKSNVKKFRRIVIAFLICAMTLSVSTGCENNDSASESSAGGGYSVWTTTALDKVCRNLEYSDDAKQNTEISISMCRNEAEGAQIIISADEDIAEYNVEVSSLVSGTNIISSENISVYNEKYIEITKKINSNNTFPVGSFVPDAILPFATAVEYKENTVKAGENQGIYVEVKTESYMSAGLYRGKVTLTIDGSKVIVPMSVNVRDFMISETGTSMNNVSTFGRDSFATMEMDATDEMAEAYYEKFLEYRMCGDLPFSGKGGTERYVELLRKYWNHSGFTTYRFYYNTTDTVDSYKGIKTNGCNTEELTEYLEAVIYASLEDNVDYLSKAIFYFSNWIDEPNDDAAYRNVSNCLTYYKTVLSDVDASVRQKLCGHENYAYYTDVVSDTLLSIPCVLPETNMLAKTRIEENGTDNVTHCPLINLLASEEQRAFYADDVEDYWAYTCGAPLYPNPSNHLDDYMVGWRVLFWMQKAYGFKGYLNWAACNYGTDNTHTAMVDPYEDCTRGWDAPGDGFMYYPGAKYGIYGPVASLRAVAFRDGMEEFEYLTVLENLYGEAGIDCENVMQSLYDRLFYGSTPTTSSAALYSVKEELETLIEDADGDFGIIFDTIEISGTKARVSFVTNNANVEVSKGGQKLSPDNGKYTLDVDLTAENAITLDLTYQGESKQIVKRISGETTLIEVETQSDIGMFAAKPESELTLNTDKNFVMAGNASMKVVLNGKYFGEGKESQTAGYLPFIRFNTENLSDLTEVENIYFNIYNDSDKDVTVSLLYYTDRNNHISDVTLKHGWNQVVVKNVYSINGVQNIKYLFIRTANLLAEDGKTELSLTLYVDDITYSKR